jgi:hypothetical protein
MPSNQNRENSRDSRSVSPMRPLDDRFFGGPERQANDWDRRAFDANYYDRAEGMYDAGGRDFSERMRNLDGRDFQQAHGRQPLERPWVHQSFRTETPTGQESGFVENIKSFLGIGPDAYHRTDESVREEVCEALSRHPEVNAADIEVEVKDGHVILLGTVESRLMKRQAQDAVAHAQGVQEVRNELTIPRNTDCDGDLFFGC